MAKKDILEIKEYEVLKLLKQGDVSYDEHEISSKLGMDINDVVRVLGKLEGKMLVIKTKKGNRYRATNNVIGELRVPRGGKPYVKVNDETINVEKRNLGNAISGDMVVVSVYKERKEEIIHPGIEPKIDKAKNAEGVILASLERKYEYETGTVILDDGRTYIELSNNIRVIPDEIFAPGSLVQFKLGDRVESNDIRFDLFEGKDFEVYSHINDPKSDILTVLARYGIETEFSEEAMKQVYNIPTEVTEDDLVGIEDGRHLDVFTIDGADAKDKDDAVYAEMMENGNIKLRIDIAHVSHYIKKNTPLYHEARMRGNSYYHPGGAVPALPPEISNWICSLHELMDRLTVCTEIIINNAGDIVDYRIFSSVIRSRKSMTYDGVQGVLDGVNNDLSYEPFEKTIFILNEMRERSINRRRKRGAIFFDTGESKIVVDENGKALDIQRRMSSDAESIIEEAMLYANEAMTNMFYNMEIDFVHRVHESPDYDKLTKFVKFISYLAKVRVDMPDKYEINPKSVQYILDAIEEHPCYDIFAGLLLRCMKKAKYSEEDYGHFGLAMNRNTHTTAPIRRFVDLENQIMFDGIESGEYFMEYNKEANLLDLSDISRNSSICEMIADEMEREIFRMKAAEYMSSREGESFEGRITSVQPFGLYVDIYNGAEGLIKIESLNNATYEEEKHMIRTKDESYRIGDTVIVIVKKAIKEVGFIDLELDRKLENIYNIRNVKKRERVRK